MNENFKETLKKTYWNENLSDENIAGAPGSQQEDCSLSQLWVDFLLSSLQDWVSQSAVSLISDLTWMMF